MENFVEVQHIVSQPVQLQLSGASHHNQRLFSDHYLDHILPRHWDSLRDEASRVMLQLQELYARFTPNVNNEAQTEDDWIKPVLRAMGHTFEVQACLKTPDGAKRPDFFFYRDTQPVCSNKITIMNAHTLYKRD